MITDANRLILDVMCWMQVIVCDEGANVFDACNQVGKQSVDVLGHGLRELHGQDIWVEPKEFEHYETY